MMVRYAPVAVLLLHVCVHYPVVAYMGSLQIRSQAIHKYADLHTRRQQAASTRVRWRESNGKEGCSITVVHVLPARSYALQKAWCART